MANIVQLVKQDPDNKKPVSQFLRDLADDIDSGETPASGAIVALSFYEKDNLLRTAVRWCNLDFLRRVGLLHTAEHDIQRNAEFD